MNYDYVKGLAITAGATLVFLGMAILVGSLAFCTKLNLEHDLPRAALDANATTFLVIGALLAGVGVAIGIVGLSQLPALDNDVAKFQRQRLGLGYVVTLLSVLVLLAFAGLGANGYLDMIFPRPVVQAPANNDKPNDMPTDKPASANPAIGKTESPSSESMTQTLQQPPKDLFTNWVSRSALLLCSMAMAILGVLFSILDSMSKKATTDEEFNSDMFWAGLWYRTGESVLFTIVLFLSIRRMSPDGNNDFWLPLLALFMGMFIKTAERIVFGLGTRTLEASEALLSLRGAGGGGGAGDAGREARGRGGGAGGAGGGQ